MLRSIFSRVHYASHHGHNKMLVELLHQKGCPSDEPDEFSVTPIQKASRGGYADCVLTLLKAKVNCLIVWSADACLVLLPRDYKCRNTLLAFLSSTWHSAAPPQLTPPQLGTCLYAGRPASPSARHAGYLHPFSFSRQSSSACCSG